MRRNRKFISIERIGESQDLLNLDSALDHLYLNLCLITCLIYQILLKLSLLINLDANLFQSEMYWLYLIFIFWMYLDLAVLVFFQKSIQEKVLIQIWSFQSWFFYDRGAVLISCIPHRYHGCQLYIFRLDKNNSLPYHAHNKNCINF